MKAVLVQHIFAPVRIVKGTRSVIRAGGKTQQRAYCGKNKRYGFFSYTNYNIFRPRPQERRKILSRKDIWLGRIERGIMHKECIVKRNAMHKNANRGTGENGRVQNVRVRLLKGRE